MTFSTEQREWLIANRREHNGKSFDEWVYRSNAKPFIDEMVEQGLMRPKYGAFVMAKDSVPPDSVELLGKVLPIQTMISIYVLTRFGQENIAEAKAGAA